MKLLKDLIIAIISIGSLSYLLFLLYLYFNQERLIFLNSLAPKEIDLPKEAKRLFVEGVEVALIDRGADTTLFYFGGNANNAFEFLKCLKELPYNIVAMNYPGFGKSVGKPSQKAIFEAAKKVFKRFKTKKNIVVGRSLGTAVAAYISQDKDISKVILITPFYSLKELAKRFYPGVPVSLILKHPFETYRYIEKSGADVYVILAQNDETTPRESYEKLKKHIKNLKDEVVIEGSSHGDILSFPKTCESVKRFGRED